MGVPRGRFEENRKKEQRRELQYWLGWLIINPKWGKRKILWDIYFYPCLLCYAFMGNHIKYFIKKSIYCLDFRKEGLGYPSQQVTMTNQVFAQGKVNMNWMVGKDIFKYQ